MSILEVDVIIYFPNSGRRNSSDCEIKKKKKGSCFALSHLIINSIEILRVLVTRGYTVFAAFTLQKIERAQNIYPPVCSESICLSLKCSCYF